MIFKKDQKDIPEEQAEAASEEGKCRFLNPNQGPLNRRRQSTTKERELKECIKTEQLRTFPCTRKEKRNNMRKENRGKEKTILPISHKS